MDLGQRIAYLRKKHNLSQYALAEHIGFSRGKLANYEQGTRSPDYETLQKIAKFFDVSRAYLLGDDDKMPSNIFPLPDKDQYIPLLGRITAGVPVDRVENIESYIAVDVNTVGSHDAFALRVRGDSMNGDGIKDGYIAICISTPDVSSNDIAVVAIDGEEATLKRVEHVGDTCFLIASNPEFRPQVQKHNASDIYILGKVVEFRGKPPSE